MTATPQDAVAKLEDAWSKLLGTTKSGQQMIKSYGADSTKWPSSTLWQQAREEMLAAEGEILQLVSPAPAPTPDPTPTPTPTPVPSALPVGGFSPGGRFRSSMSATDLNWEFNEYAAVSAGHPMMLRVDAEDVVQRCLDSGFHVCLVVGNTIHGFASLPGGSVAAYAGLCGDIAARWKGKVGKNGARLAILEAGGNEPNINGISAAQEVQILKAVTPRVKAADSTLLVCNGGLSPSATSSPRDYFAGMIAAGLALGDLDLYQGHIYEDMLARGTWNTCDQTWPYGNFPVGTTIRELLDAHGMKTVPIMSGESGRHDSSATVIHNGFAEFGRRRANGEPIGPYLVFTMRADWITSGTDSGFSMTALDRSRRPGWYEAQKALAAV